MRYTFTQPGNPGLGKCLSSDDRTSVASSSLPVPFRLWVTVTSILILEVLGIAWLGNSLGGSVLANTIQTAASLLAAACCFRARQRALALGRHFWILVGLGFLTWALANMAWAYYEDLLRVPIPTPSFVHFLFDVWGGFFAMALFLSEERDSDRLDWRTLLDFLQIAIVFSFLYFNFYYVPALSLSSDSLLVRESVISVSEIFGLALLALVRIMLVRSSVLRSLYLNTALFLAFFTVCAALADYGQSYKKIPTGSWYDLLWTLPFLLGSVMASKWQQPQQATLLDVGTTATLSRVAAGNLMLGLAPLFIAVEAVRLPDRWESMAIYIICVSGACYAFRLILDEYAEVTAAQTLRDSLAALRSSEEKYRTFIAQSSEGIFRVEYEPPVSTSLAAADQIDLCFKNGYLAECNDALAGMYGSVSARSLVSKRVSEWFTPDEPLNRQFVKQFVSNAYQVIDFEFRRRNENGKMLIFRTGMIGFVDRGLLRQAWGIQRDVTDRVKLEDQLRQAQKMEAVGRLAGGVAHDFNNILSVIIGYCELTTDLANSTGSIARNISRIKQAAEKAASLTKQLLSFSRQQVVHPRVIDLNKVVQNASEMLQRMVGDDVSLSFKPATGLGMTKVDPGQIELVLMNLGVNARDAMPAGGKILIETKNVSIDEHYVRGSSTIAPGSYVMLSFGDTGVGIASEILPEIFQPFFTTKGLGKGTGLGLATVHGIVAQSSGHIDVYSELNVGTTFKIYFPRVQDKESAVELESEADSVRGSETILLVEDEASLREVATVLLEASGYRVLQAENAGMALALAQSAADRIDLLLTDIVMPTMNGIELGRRLRELYPGILLLYMSGYMGEQLEHYEQVAPEAKLLEKPFTKRSLLRTVRLVLDG